MVIISKALFYEKVGPEIKCKDLIHNWTDSCFEGYLSLCFKFSKGIFYLYLPIYLFKIIISYKKINKKYIKNILKASFKSYCYAFALGSLTVSSVCCASNLMKRLYYWNLSYIPGFISGLSIFLEQPETRYFNTLLWTSMVVESFFTNAYYFNIIQFSPAKETVIFMAASSFLMYLLTKSKKDNIPFNIWFYDPNTKDRCHSREASTIACLNSGLKEFLKYFGIGFALNGVRHLAGAIETIFKNPSKVIFRSIFNKNNVQFGMVVGAYAGLYKIVSYLLQKYSKAEKSCNAAMAGLIAGISYYIKPTINILAIAITTIFQTLCYDFITIPKHLEKIPILELLFMIFNSILLRNRIVAMPTCPKYYTKMLKIASGGVLDQIYSVMVKKYILA